MIIIVSGSRELRDSSPIVRAFDELAAAPTVTVPVFVYHGAQRGADTLAELDAKRRGWRVCPVSADWETFRHLNGAAGPIRSAEMIIRAMRHAAIDAHELFFLGFPRRGVQGGGTQAAIALARILKVPTIHSFEVEVS